MNLIIPDWEDMPSNIGALATTRSGGVSRAPYDDGTGKGGLNLGMHVGDDPQAVARNRALLQTLLPSQPAWLSQVHGTHVVDAAVTNTVPEADGSIASRPGVVCVIQTADCLPVLFCDVAGKVVGAAHAGWRGLAGGVLQNTVEAMRVAGAGDITAWMGPAIGPKHFEVGDDVRQAFCNSRPETVSAFISKPDVTGKYLANIYELARLVLQEAGIKRVFGGTFCTVSSPEHFYSYRRDKTTGRMASLIWIK